MPTPPAVSDRLFALRLVSVSAPASPPLADLPVAGAIVVGRDPDATLVVADPSVSRRHVSVEPTADGLRVVDLNSGNGLWVGEVRVADVVLREGETARIGKTQLMCVAVAAADPAPAAGFADTVIMPAPAPARLPGPPEAVRVLVVEGGDVVPTGLAFDIGESATIGRGADCAVRLAESDISRLHCRLDVTASGVTLTDLGSTGGTWIDDAEVKSTALIPGRRFRLGSRLVLECTWTTAAAPAEAQDDSTRFVSASVLAAASEAGPRPVTANRTPQSDAPAPQPDAPAAVPAAHASGEVTRPSPETPASPPPVPPTPIDQRLQPVEALAPAAHGGAAAPSSATPSSLPPINATSAVGQADFSGTVMVALTPEMLAAVGSQRFEDEGEPLEVNAHRPFLLDDPDAVWYVVKGSVLIFTVALEQGQPVGTRTHFLGVMPGQAIFGFARERFGGGSGFLAVGSQGTVVRRMTLRRVQEIAAVPTRAAAVAALVDAWITGLARALVATGPPPRADRAALATGRRVDLTTATRATAESGVVWVELTSGAVQFNDMVPPVFTSRSVPFPLTADSWVQSVSDEFGPLAITPVRTTELVGRGGLWRGLEVFHQVICECEFTEKKLSTVDEYLRQQDKARNVDAARAAAYEAIGSVLSNEGHKPREFLAHGEEDVVLAACRLVGQAAGVDVREHPAKQQGLSFEQQVSAIASASGFRTRVVALRDDWMRGDNGPLLGQWAESKEPVALLPTGPRSYDVVDPKAGTRGPVTTKLADTLSSFGYTFYRPFPETELGVSDLVKFGALGIRRDLMWVVYMALIVGIFGTVTPFITGRVFDSAIPQADRAALYLLGAALVASGLASAAFKFTQGIATIRVQRRMAAPIQSAVWDRILNLPVNFFRQYSAGDLADRAEGVSAIQDLVSGAGIAAILGSISGLFFVGQMFAYHSSLALIAVGLTALFVTVTTSANYLQLRYQRLEFQMRGRITGLVLNLLTGVTKLRVCGAEPHAFRIWAEQFAAQRRVSFTVGSIQNGATVFATVFPVLSSIAIFYTLLSLQDGGSAEPGFSTGDFIAFNTAYGLFLAAMQALGDASLSLLRVVPIYERFKPILLTKPEVDQSKTFPGRLEGAIELSRVSFRYDSDGPWIIRDVSFKINPGEFVAFVGSSGGGKSTLMRMMLGFETPTSGSVLFDGQDLAALDLRMVRQQLGVVLQASRVMPTEIYRNIVGVTSRTIEDAWDAAERAGLAEDIRAMPMGMHTYVSEGGGTLSGGQRQRLMIARAIVNKPKILFLDEATSALDNRAQAIVTESMDRMDATRIVIAHRLSTIVNANRIFYLHGGQIAESGTYQELMAKGGLFAQLAQRQMA